jgi:hypothetical protein
MDRPVVKSNANVVEVDRALTALSDTVPAFDTAVAFAASDVLLTN